MIKPDVRYTIIPMRSRNQRSFEEPFSREGCWHHSQPYGVSMGLKGAIKFIAFGPMHILYICIYTCTAEIWAQLPVPFVGMLEAYDNAGLQ